MGVGGTVLQGTRPRGSTAGATAGCALEMEVLQVEHPTLLIRQARGSLLPTHGQSEGPLLPSPLPF